jgi:hypothetical protein
MQGRYLCFLYNHTVNYRSKQHVSSSFESVVLKEVLESLHFNFFESCLCTALCNTECYRKRILN